MERQIADTYVLDSWPIMEWVQQREPSASEIDRLLQLAVQDRAKLIMSAINYGEVLYSCWRKFPRDEADRVLADVETFPIEIIAPDTTMVEQAAHIKVGASASYADCFAAASAIQKQVPLIIGDKEFLKLEPCMGLQLHWVGA